MKREQSLLIYAYLIYLNFSNYRWRIHARRVKFDLMSWTPLDLHGSSPSAGEAKEATQKTKRQVSKKGRQHKILSMISLVWYVLFLKTESKQITMTSYRSNEACLNAWKHTILPRISPRPFRQEENALDSFFQRLRVWQIADSRLWTEQKLKYLHYLSTARLFRQEDNAVDFHSSNEGHGETVADCQVPTLDLTRAKLFDSGRYIATCVAHPEKVIARVKLHRR